MAVPIDGPDTNRKGKPDQRLSEGAAGGNTTATSITAMIEFSVLHSSVRGRLRLHVVGLFRRPDLANEVEDRLCQIAVISAVEVSSLTGTALLKFGPSTSNEDVLQLVAGVLAGSRTKRRQARGATRSTVNPRANGQKAATKSSKSEIRGYAGRQAAPAKMNGSTIKPSELPAAWHAKTAEAVLIELTADVVHGLSSEMAASRLDTFGRNETAERPPASAFALVTRQITSLPVGLLLGASVVSLLTGGFVDALITLGVVVLNAGIGYGTESGSERIIRSMTQRQPLSVPVVRDAKECTIDHSCIVPGDLLPLRPNTVIAADASNRQRWPHDKRGAADRRERACREIRAARARAK